MDRETLKTSPAVFVAGDNYQIVVIVKKETLMWVKVGDKCYYDHSNGTLRSAEFIHYMNVPMEVLDKERKYQLFYRVVKERKPYFTQTEEVVCEEFTFYPVKGEGARAYFLADAHNQEEALIQAVKAFEKCYGEIDFLILGGDNINDSGRVENFETIYRLAEAITRGEKPIVNARGNHDLRGIYAEKTELYFPTVNGKFYYTFRLGNIWGIILDCGEDKEDNHAEYGYTVVCHAFREEETEFLEKVIRAADSEYDAENVAYKLVVSHLPFFYIDREPFDIEREIYSEWCRLLREHVKPQLMLSGHQHEIKAIEVGDLEKDLGQPCKAIIGSKPYKGEDGKFHFIGTGLFFQDGRIDFVFNDDTGKEYQ